MATHMKTTLDLSDALFFDAKQTAKAQQTTLRALIEEGLRHVLGERKRAIKPAFKLRNASVPGGGALTAHAAMNAENEMAFKRHLRVDAQMHEQMQTQKNRTA